MSAPKSAQQVLESLMAQRRVCRGEDCKSPRCKRCKRGRAVAAGVRRGTHGRPPLATQQPVVAPTGDAA